jgi:hypothetical protein
MRQGHPNFVMGSDKMTELTLVACGTPSEGLLREVFQQARNAGFGRLRSVGPGGVHQFPPVPLQMTAENAFTYARRLTGPGPVLLITDGSTGWPQRLGPDRILVSTSTPPPQLRGYVVNIPERPGPEGP